ncbi:unnamed protein product [Protopolystoma xenopodis]|uniref:Uncharacterized protein n=1 Tax=Protopolystoma xenopodis TaxID=117903 RepID=A0A3S5B8Z8_9PLAT|nr:unnamed protein product [Protopolystoma xenopodis]
MSSKLETRVESSSPATANASPAIIHFSFSSSASVSNCTSRDPAGEKTDQPHSSLKLHILQNCPKPTGMTTVLADISLTASWVEPTA